MVLYSVCSVNVISVIIVVVRIKTWSLFSQSFVLKKVLVLDKSQKMLQLDVFKFGNFCAKNDFFSKFKGRLLLEMRLQLEIF